MTTANFQTFLLFGWKDTHLLKCKKADQFQSKGGKTMR